MKILYFVISASIIAYLSLPNPKFPAPPRGALKSEEPADTESPLRRGYFTNLTREEVMIHYMKQVNISKFLSIPLPTYRLNYPPEEANTIIRDQTRSTFLEEIVHPLRESLFVSGFESDEPKDEINREGKKWRQKITIKLVPSNYIARMVVVSTGLVLFWIVLKEFEAVIRKNLKK